MAEKKKRKSEERSPPKHSYHEDPQWPTYPPLPRGPPPPPPHGDRRKALKKALPRVRRSQQGAMVVQPVSRCVWRCHCGSRVMPVWCCCASGIRPGVCCAFCACYALHVSQFWPSSGGQHPVFRVLQAPVRVKEEPPDSPERHAE